MNKVQRFYCLMLRYFMCLQRGGRLQQSTK